MLELLLGANQTRPLTILCLGAHSDDIEIGCGGTLLRLLAERSGSTVNWVVFSADDERERETRSSAACFLEQAEVAEVVVNRFRESYFPGEWTAIKETFRALTTPKPDVVFCHRRDDEHQDHRTIGELAWNTFRDHFIAEYEIPKYEGDLGHPNFYVPLAAETAERKVEILLEHFPSQHSKPWFRPELFRGLMAVRGIECNAPHGWAEAFHVRKAVLTFAERGA